MEMVQFLFELSEKKTENKVKQKKTTKSTRVENRFLAQCFGAKPFPLFMFSPFFLDLILSLADKSMS